MLQLCSKGVSLAKCSIVKELPVAKKLASWEVMGNKIYLAHYLHVIIAR